MFLGFYRPVLVLPHNSQNIFINNKLLFYTIIITTMQLSNILVEKLKYYFIQYIIDLKTVIYK